METSTNLVDRRKGTVSKSVLDAFVIGKMQAYVVGSDETTIAGYQHPISSRHAESVSLDRELTFTLGTARLKHVNVCNGGLLTGATHHCHRFPAGWYRDSSYRVYR